MRSLLSEQLAAARANSAPASQPDHHPSPSPALAPSPDHHHPSPNSPNSPNSPQSSNSDDSAPHARAHAAVSFAANVAQAADGRGRGASVSSAGAGAGARESPPQARLRMKYYQALNLSSQPVQVPARRASEGSALQMALSAPVAIPVRPNNWGGDKQGAGGEELGWGAQSVASKSFAPEPLAVRGGGGGGGVDGAHPRRRSDHMPRRAFIPPHELVQMGEEDFEQHRPHRRDKALI